MTREEAIHFAVCLKNNWTIDFNDMEEFCDMAIEALSAEIVRCKDCRYYECAGLPCPLDVCESLGDDGFCSCGERKGGEDE